MSDLADKIKFCDSYSRLPALIELFEPGNSEWFALLGHVWSVCDNVSQYQDELRVIFNHSPPALVALVMDEDERADFEALPDEITIYRGCYEFNRRGLSWTLDRSVAESFTTQNRYHHPDKEPMVLEAVANKSDCLLKLGRDEKEIVCFVE